MKIGENWWKLVILVSPTIPQHMYIFRIVLLSPLIICHQNWRKMAKIGENWWKLEKFSEIGITYNTPTYIYFRRRLVKLIKIFWKFSANFLKIFENWWKLVKISEIGITYNTPTYIYFWNSLFEPIKILWKW